MTAGQPEEAGCQLEYPRCFSGAETSISREELWAACVLYASPNNDLWPFSNLKCASEWPRPLIVIEVWSPSPPSTASRRPQGT